MIRTRTLMIWIPVLVACTASPHPWGNRAWAESALPLISGFDAQRVESAYPVASEAAAGELSKLLYRLRSVAPATLESIAPGHPPYHLGDVAKIDGEIRQIKSLRVPDGLVEFLGFSRLDIIDVATGEGVIPVITTGFPTTAARGDRVQSLGVVIETDAVDTAAAGRLAAAATPRFRWNPTSPKNTGWKLLSEQGVDISALAEVGARNRQPLAAADGDAFYAMLAAAARLTRQEPPSGEQGDAEPANDLPTPRVLQPVLLLSQPETFLGDWLRLDLETVQVTRIAVSEPHRQAQLGSDHYFQIDAVGDLENVVVRIERAPGEASVGPPVLFENRYPVSVVTRELPGFLSQAIRDRKGGDAVVSQIKMMVEVDAFFFRLWSYSSEFMDQRGGGEQFGPLLIAARIGNREPTSSDPAGVGIIAWIAAAGVISGILAIWLWTRAVAARDREVREKRSARESEQLQLP